MNILVKENIKISKSLKNKYVNPPYRGNLKCAILDWSGTTIDPHVLAPAIVFCDVFKMAGVPITMQEARKPMGLRKDLHIAEILKNPDVKHRWISKKGYKPTQKNIDMLFKNFVPQQLDCLQEYSKLIPGTVNTVNILRNEYRLKIGSTTGFTKIMVDKLLKDAKKQGYVPDSSVAGDEVENNMGFRPAPFMIYANLVKLGVFPIESVLKVDDTISGIGEGLNAGCWTVGLSNWSNYTNVDSIKQWNKMSKEEQRKRQDHSRYILTHSGAHYVCDDINDLPGIVEDINKRLSNGEKP